MRLRILSPASVVVDEPVSRIVADSPSGRFGILPRHLDFVTPLSPGVLVYVTEDGRQRYVAVDEGVLVKRAEQVMAAVRRAVPGEALESLRAIVEEEFEALDDRERTTRSALARLEADFVRRFTFQEEG